MIKVGHMLRHLRCFLLPGALPKAAALVAPYVAVASAGIVNVFVMRWNEIEKGVKVTDLEVRRAKAEINSARTQQFIIF